MSVEGYGRTEQSDGTAVSCLAGDAGAGISAVRLMIPGREPVVASLAQGHFAVWWPTKPGTSGARLTGLDAAGKQVTAVDVDPLTRKPEPGSGPAKPSEPGPEKTRWRQRARSAGGGVPSGSPATGPWLAGRAAGWEHRGMLGTLTTEPALTRTDLLAAPVVDALAGWRDDAPVDVDDVLVAPIDPDLADTAAFCAAYQVGPEVSANCVVVAGKREGGIRYAACVVLATTRADVNGLVRRHLGVRKASFAPMADAVALTGMEYGGITPVGLPADWPVLVDARVVGTPYVIVGSGLRRSKIALPGPAVGALPNAVVLDDLGHPPV
jgi:prolyl-tRNA editing enzyme YbaK/EbsC (Cys-tRNA(Pro) deacylase)